MTLTLRHTHRPDAPHQIRWRPWGSGAFEEAASAGRLVFLNLTASWNEACRELDADTLSDDRVGAVLNTSFVPVRVDTDRLPHVQDRYIAGSWPTNAFLTPTGEVLWSGNGIGAEALLDVADAVRHAWSQNRESLQLEIERRRRGHEAGRRETAGGLVRRDAARDVTAAARAMYDAQHGGFGPPPKYPPGDAIELLLTMSAHGDAEAAGMVDQTLDGMRNGLIDIVDGGSFRCAAGGDWSAPSSEKLLDINAVQLESYALGASVRGRDEWADVAAAMVSWVDATLGLPSGLWGASQRADAFYFACDATRRGGLEAPAVDTTLFTCWNAQWIAALACAGGRLGRHAWITRAASAYVTLSSAMTATNGLFYHYCTTDGDRDVDYLLLDVLEMARAAMMLFQATGSTACLGDAQRWTHMMEKSFWATDGGFWDCADSEGTAVLRYRDRAFDMNARAARLLLDLHFATGERRYRALAERTLAVLSPRASRLGVGAAAFALAVEEFFTTPACVAIVGDAASTQPLRRAALCLPLPGHRVWSLPAGGRLGTVAIPASPSTAAYAVRRSGCSAPILDPAALATAFKSPK
ncbi:MAG TPA: DUF255 domain-containing protein [Longimicrobiales bacterium]